MEKVSNQRDEILGEGAMTVDDSVAWSGVGRTKLYRAMAEGNLAFVQQGKRRLIPRVALRRMLNENLVEPANHAR